MQRIHLILPALMLFLSSCGTSETPLPAIASVPPTEGPLPMASAVCISPMPTQQDIERALSFAEDMLDTDEWEQAYTVSDASVSVTWQNIPQNAVIYIEAQIFACGYEEPDLDHYFNDANWDAIFANYESYELIGECNTHDGLRLYQFEASSEGFDYEIQYWVINDTDTRVITTMMIFPFGSESQLDYYSERFFTEEVTCP